LSVQHGCAHKTCNILNSLKRADLEGPIGLKRFKSIHSLAGKTDKFPGRIAAMIFLTHLNNTPLVINPALIVFIEKTPDTIITLSNGEKIAVLEKVKEVIQRVIKFRRCIFNFGLQRNGNRASG
jgi:flagellar protein FlbD